MTRLHTLKSVYTDFYSVYSLREAANQIKPLTRLQKPFFVIGMPGSLHFVDLCLRFIPNHHEIIFVANGLSSWEEDWAKKNLQLSGFIRIHRPLQHGLVLDFLLRNFKSPFGILDYDCFVINPELFSSISKIDSNSMLNAVYCYKNQILDFEIAETFLLFLNPEVILQIQDDYRVNSRQIDYSDLSNKVKRKLLEIGIDKNHLPEEYKPYFDTMRLWFPLELQMEKRAISWKSTQSSRNQPRKSSSVGGGRSQYGLHIPVGCAWRLRLETHP